MTYSIIARDPSSGKTGIAVASRFFAVGALVPHIRPPLAVATQAFVNPLWGSTGLSAMNDGHSAAEVIAELAAHDRHADQRQAHMLDSAGDFAAHTGKSCIGWAGHLIGDHVSVAGNMLAGPEVLEAARDSFVASAGQALEDRLLLAMKAGETAGGDRRGRQSAAIRVHRGEVWPLLDIRVDDSADPLTDLRRLLAVARERYLHFAEELGTAADFSGQADRPRLEAAIAAGQTDRQRRGEPATVSFATGSPL